MDQKGSSPVIAIFLIVVFVLIVGGVYSFNTKKSHNSSIGINSQESNRVTQPESNVQSITFEESLEENCRNISKNGGIFYGVEPEKLPLKIDKKVILIDYLIEDTITCEGINHKQGHAWVSFKTKNEIQIDIFKKTVTDDISRLLLPKGQLFKSSNAVNYYISLDKDAMAPKDINYYWLSLIGEKEILLSTGELIVIRAREKVLKENNVLLVEILAPKSHVTRDNKFKEIEKEEGEKAVLASFSTSNFQLENTLNEETSFVLKQIEAITAN